MRSRSTTITSKIKHAIKAVIGCKLKQNANEGCNSCASLAGLVLCFTAYFILLVIAPLRQKTRTTTLVAAVDPGTREFRPMVDILSIRCELGLGGRTQHGITSSKLEITE